MKLNSIYEMFIICQHSARKFHLAFLGAAFAVYDWHHDVPYVRDEDSAADAWLHVQDRGSCFYR